MSKKQNPPTLLKQLPSKLDDVDPDAPPQSSDDEESTESKRGEIKSTVWPNQGERSASKDDGSAPETNITTSPPTRSTRGRPKRSFHEVEGDPIEDEGLPNAPPPPKKAATERKTGQQNLGSHLDFGVFGRPRPKAPITFAGRGNSRTHTAAKRPERKTPKLKLPPSANDSGEADAQRPTLRMPPAAPDSSPTKASPKTKLPATKNGRTPIRPARSKSEIAKRKAQEEKKKAEEEAKKRQPPVLRLPPGHSHDFHSDKEDEPALEEADITLPILQGSPLKNLDSALGPNGKPICPTCDEELDESFMEEFRARPARMNIYQEAKFCRSHRKKSAQKEWQNRGYPDIDWTVMDNRIKNHHDFLRSILNGGKSYYANVFSDRIKSGQNKTLIKSDVNLTPGYYGMRGLRVMTEHINYKLASDLRKSAVRHRLVAARGHTTYVQSVLVPELAVRLIMEDREKHDEKVTEEEARNIMNDSIWVGELLNEEVADQVLYEDEEEEESQREELGLGDEAEAHLEYESKFKQEDEENPKRRNWDDTDLEEEEIKPNGNDAILIEDSDKVKSEDQIGTKKESRDIKSNGDGFPPIKDEKADDESSTMSPLSDLSDSSLSDLDPNDEDLPEF